MPITYPTIDRAIEVHRKTVEVSGGGVLGHLDMEREPLPAQIELI